MTLGAISGFVAARHGWRLMRSIEPVSSNTKPPRHSSRKLTGLVPDFARN